MKDLFYVKKSSDVVTPDGDTAAFVDAKYDCYLWHPASTSIRPHGITEKSFLVWWLLHKLHIFANRGYSLLVIYESDKLVHRSVVFPRYFRFPFMARDDLQIGDTWTAPEHRGQGLATLAIRNIVKHHAKVGRRFWYVVEEDNLASIRAVEKVGFRLVGEGVRTRRLGLRVLGAYVLEAQF